MKYIFILPLLITLALGAPATYDQRQDGEINVRADLQNFVVVALVPKIGSSGSALLDLLSKSIQARKGLRNSNRRHQNLEAEPTEEDHDTADPRIAEPFLKSKSTYHVDISEAKSNFGDVYRAESKSDSSPESKSAFSTNLKLAERKQSVESPIPDVLPVKDNRYVMTADRSGKIVKVISISGNIDSDSNVSEKKADDSVSTEVIILSDNVSDDSEVAEKVDSVSTVDKSNIVNVDGDKSETNEVKKNILTVTLGDIDIESKPSGNINTEVDDGSRVKKDSGLLLLGAREQCGPDGYRDSAGICQLL